MKLGRHHPLPHLLAAFVLLAGACGAGAPVATQATAPSTGAPTAATDWRLELRVSGGFAGFDRVLELTSAGAVVARDWRRAQQVNASLASGELQALDTAVRRARPSDVRAGGCADCLEYQLAITLAGRAILIRTNDAGLSGTEASGLIAALAQLLNRSLAEAPR